MRDLLCFVFWGLCQLVWFTRITVRFGECFIIEIFDLLLFKGADLRCFSYLVWASHRRQPDFFKWVVFLFLAVGLHLWCAFLFQVGISFRHNITSKNKNQTLVKYVDCNIANQQPKVKEKMIFNLFVFVCHDSSAGPSCTTQPPQRGTAT
jgi:hypothetical protein